MVTTDVSPNFKSEALKCAPPSTIADDGVCLSVCPAASGLPFCESFCGENCFCNYKVVFCAQITQSTVIVSYIPIPTFPMAASLPSFLLPTPALKTLCTFITSGVGMFSFAACKFL